MSSVLKGNFTPKTEVKAQTQSEEAVDLETRFEREALKKLGGSIAFVSKKKVVWEQEG